MAVLLQKMKSGYDYLFYDLADEHTRDMFPSAMFLMIILPFYVYFSKSLGPRLMKDLKPFKLRTVIMYYNLFQIYISMYIIYLAVKCGFFHKTNFMCEAIDYTDNSFTRTMRNGTWWYTIVKLIDLMDTVFFVLRKKDRQISFLHVFHHTIMPFGAFLALKYYPNGHSAAVGIINCLVHVVMYTYYFIAGLGPKYQKYLWWKKHVTTMQLIQFGIVFVHNLIPLFDSTCQYPKWINFLLCIHSSHFVYMFGSFYYLNYIMDTKTHKTVKSNGTTEEAKHL